jgi:hypothetical protein
MEGMIFEVRVDGDIHHSLDVIPLIDRLAER